jgi:hypothetical protein
LIPPGISYRLYFVQRGLVCGWKIHDMDGPPERIRAHLLLARSMGRHDDMGHIKMIKAQLERLWQRRDTLARYLADSNTTNRQRGLIRLGLTVAHWLGDLAPSIGHREVLEFRGIADEYANAARLDFSRQDHIAWLAMVDLDVDLDERFLVRSFDGIDVQFVHDNLPLDQRHPDGCVCWRDGEGLYD